ncbi:MAG: hypothetical protein AB2747_11725 [Candidatus Thiodiazotropha taylori]
MSSIFYLPRTLIANDKSYTELSLVETSNYVVILAEPGGGKTELMGSLAKRFGTTAVSASKFSYAGTTESNISLVIDAFDELAKIDSSGIFKLLGQIDNANPTHVYLSSRSSEWGKAETLEFRNFLGHDPLVVRICEFNEAEQRAIFDHHVKGENYTDFQMEVSRFELETLLPNPQFLKLFADAYVESGRHFTSKQSIFTQAVHRLAKEVNPRIATSDSQLPIAKKVELASEVFAKLLLAGAEGVDKSQATETRMFPSLASLVNDMPNIDSILSTRLFKLGDEADQHRPVHKVVAEYCAAGYLTSRIVDPSDTLTFTKCKPIVAPNSIVRDELRGLLGWMAALGNKSIEEMAIELDPYAVLANGDPSRLEQSSKLLLIKQLQKIDAIDPYFRRGDYRRRFSVAGFFNQDIINEIKPILSNGSNGQLRDLLLELLSGSPVISSLEDELCQIILKQGESESTRELANERLLEVKKYDHLSNLDKLISEGTHTSLKIASVIVAKLGLNTFDRAIIINYFQICANLYPGSIDYNNRIIGERYFLRRFINTLDLTAIEWILDELSLNLTCICGKKSYECECRNGISKIIGIMLDRYFTLANSPFNPSRIWRWVEKLNYYKQISADQSMAVKTLQEDDNLRQSILSHVFGEMSDRNQIKHTIVEKFSWHSHSGLSLNLTDEKYIVDLAFNTDNPNLWSFFVAVHKYYRKKEDRGPDSFRQHMRRQALQKPEFMIEWARSNKAMKKSMREHLLPSIKRSRKMKRNRKQEESVRVANKRFVQDNRDLVESGNHWGCLVHFSELVLNTPGKIVDEYGDEELVRNALKNCLDFIDPLIPDLKKLAELQCDSKCSQSEKILYAACLEILRSKGDLLDVKIKHLEALRTHLVFHYNAVSEDEINSLKAEVDRLIFTDSSDPEKYLKQYLEPQLEDSDCVHPEISLLQNDDIFAHLKQELSIDWISRFDELKIDILINLFDLAAEYGNRDDLKEIIRNRCDEFNEKYPTPTSDEELEQKRKFWFIRAWYFLDNATDIYWEWLKKDKRTVLTLCERSGRLSDGYPFWPKLTSSKVEAILDAFFDQWPKVRLPSYWGTGSPDEEKAYRFLSEVVWKIESEDPDNAIPVIDRLLGNARYVDLHKDLQNIRAAQIRKKALRDFEPPEPIEIVNLLDRDEVVTVEGLRQLLIDELDGYQKLINGGEFNTVDLFYQNGKRHGEVRSAEIIAGHLSTRLQPKGITVVLEHQLKDAKRCDFTATKLIGSKRRLLVTEVKGQWHEHLYTAASTQLHDRYSIHPDAEQQGIYLALWFGVDEKVADRKKHGIVSSNELKSSIEAAVIPELKGLIDVYVLDLSRSQ